MQGALPGGPVVSQGDENQRKYGKFESKAFWIRWWVSQGEMQGGILNEDETIFWLKLKHQIGGKVYIINFSSTADQMFPKLQAKYILSNTSEFYLRFCGNLVGKLFKLLTPEHLGHTGTNFEKIYSTYHTTMSFYSRFYSVQVCRGFGMRFIQKTKLIH